MPTPAQLLPTLGECAVSLCELAALISSGALTLSDEEARTVSVLANILARVAKGEDLAPWWSHLAAIAAREPPGSYDAATYRAELRQQLRL